MTPATQTVVSIALDQALAAHVCRLYEVLMAEGDGNGDPHSCQVRDERMLDAVHFMEGVAIVDSRPGAGNAAY